MTLKKLGIWLGAVMAVWAAVIVTLHFGQIYHDHLNFDVEATFPPNQPFMPGEIYATTLAEIVDHELNTGFGWRPNDLFIWGPTVMADNNSNRQIGIIMAVRESTRVFKDDLTKISSNEYDPNLVIADTDFRNDAQKWILPSAESKYADGVAHLRLYVAGLHANPETSRELNQRNVELVTLFEAWTDLLGDAHAMLYMQQNPDGSPVRPWQDDNYFYHAQGYAHVMYYLMLAIKREYHQSQTIKPVIGQLFDETIIPLRDAAMLKPLIVLNGAPDGILANHRRNLDGYITEARQKMFSIRDELAH
jgi:hypothetical protein